MGRRLKYIGPYDWLGEIVKEQRYYWLINPYIRNPDGKIIGIENRLVSHPKAFTEAEKETETIGGLIQND